jgi:hypothetical protein
MTNIFTCKALCVARQFADLGTFSPCNTFWMFVSPLHHFLCSSYAVLIPDCRLYYSVVLIQSNGETQVHWLSQHTPAELKYFRETVDCQTACLTPEYNLHPLHCPLPWTRPSPAPPSVREDSISSCLRFVFHNTDTSYLPRPLGLSLSVIINNYQEEQKEVVYIYAK